MLSSSDFEKVGDQAFIKPDLLDTVGGHPYNELVSLDGNSSGVWPEFAIERRDRQSSAWRARSDRLPFSSSQLVARFDEGLSRAWVPRYDIGLLS